MRRLRFLYYQRLLGKQVGTAFAEVELMFVGKQGGEACRRSMLSWLLSMPAGIQSEAAALPLLAMRILEARSTLSERIAVRTSLCQEYKWLKLSIDSGEVIDENAFLDRAASIDHLSTNLDRIKAEISDMEAAFGHDWELLRLKTSPKGRIYADAFSMAFTCGLR